MNVCMGYQNAYAKKNNIRCAIYSLILPKVLSFDLLPQNKSLNYIFK